MTAETKQRTKKKEAKTTHKKRSDAYYRKNREKVLADTRARFLRGRALIHSLKENVPCVDCGVVFHPVAMDWHHQDRKEKIVGVSQMRGYSEAKIRAEIAKCVLICANCHRVRHFA